MPDQAFSDDNPADPSSANPAIRANQRADLDARDQDRLRTIQQLGYVPSDPKLDISSWPEEPEDTSKLGIAGWKAWLTVHHAQHPQKQHLALAALGQIEVGVAILTSLGHQFVLPKETPRVFEEFPKVMYRDGHPPVVAESKEAARRLGDGWRERRDENNPPPSTLP